MARYIVIRRHPDLPADFYLGDLEGKWMEVPDPPSDEAVLDFWPGHLTPAGHPAVAVPTGRVERREDGEHAEVYEVRP